MMVTVTLLGLCGVLWLVCPVMAFPDPACVNVAHWKSYSGGRLRAKQVEMTDCLEIHVDCHIGSHAL